MTKGKYASKQEVINGEGSVFYFVWAVYSTGHRHINTRAAANSLSAISKHLDLDESPRSLVEAVERLSPARVLVDTAITKKEAAQKTTLLGSSGFEAEFQRKLIVNDDYNFAQVAKLVRRYFKEKV